MKQAFLYFLVTLAFVCLSAARILGGSQYFIQNEDGGPERYFRYETYNGQYRKERRLKNGSVIGSYGWKDDNGVVRITDYVADKLGFRVVKKQTEEYPKSNQLLKRGKARIPWVSDVEQVESKNSAT